MNRRSVKAATYWRGRGRNFMTPEPIEYIETDNGFLVELSEGTGFNHEPIFGVSVADASGERLHDPESQMFYSRSDAMAHIRNLGK